MHEISDTRYNHLEAEEKKYAEWESSGYFNPDKLPDARNRKPFTIIMPPPNANGSLHIGHALDMTLQDILVRFWRMRGRKTLWLPGADHAGFETQVVFEKNLQKEGRTSYGMNRHALWREIWSFTQANKSLMERQLRKLGASCDWSRKTFTLDPHIIETVYDTFGRLYKDGLVYRDLKVVHWCPKHRTALSDLEVAYKEQADPLYYIAYGPLTLATVRPETKFGDTALAVNPKDKRYKGYIGKEIDATGILGPLRFKVIGDDAVDVSFGTGVVKITPAHDATDFEIWQRHKNEIPGPKIIIDESGRLTGEVGRFKGLKVSEARQQVAAAMEQAGILRKIDSNYVHQVAACYKCGSTLEPLPKPQWFIKTRPLAERAMEAVRKKKTAIIPKRSEKVYLHWLKNIRDWNISRQIAWGIRIPAYFCIGCGAVKINPKIRAKWFVVRHGETDWNKEGRVQGHADIPLNSAGISQAAQAAQTFKDTAIDLIISSDLLRARATAEAIAKTTGAEIVVDPELREQNYGIAEGMQSKEYTGLYGNFFGDYHAKPPEGESFAELEDRIWKAFVRHRKKHRHKNIVIVTHGRAMRALNKRLKDLAVEAALNYGPVKNGEILELTTLERPCSQCNGEFYEQDPDVFDTWFSSGQWPFAALLAPSKTPPSTRDFKTFYPTDVLVTGYDILFFWIARMMMLGIYRTGAAPFRTVYLHGLVRDKDRQKMSKSKGNVIDPLGVAEIYGTDAVRMALVVGNTAGNDIVISEDKIRGYRNFETKIWNAARFVLLAKPALDGQEPKLSAGDKSRIAQARKAQQKVAKHIERFEFHLAAEHAYHYFWHTFADKVIEEMKPRLQQGTDAERAAAYRVLESILVASLVMLHPFMPFITEEIFGKFRPGKLLIVEAWR